MKAWLITWQGTGRHDERHGEVASILDPRLSAKTVRDHIERLYSDRCYSLIEKLDAARAGPRKHNPYPAEFNFRKIIINGREGRQMVNISCGDNPHLLARKVSNLRVQKNKDGDEVLSWDGP